jgi:hypothetical protein
MVPPADPDAKIVRAEVSKSVKKLQEQKELLYDRLFTVWTRLIVLEAQLHEDGKNFKDRN